MDLTKIEGDGNFLCPKCGTLISPDDQTETVYTVQDTVLGFDDSLESMIIQCNKCKSVINLEGFDELVEEGEYQTAISDPLADSDAGHKTYHTIALNEKKFGHVAVEYANKEDVKAFKRLRKLRVGDPYKSTLTIEHPEGVEMETEMIQAAAKAVKRKFKGLRNRDAVSYTHLTLPTTPYV